MARITTFPEDAEEPRIELAARQRYVLSVQIHGDVSEWALRELTEQVRDRLLQDPGVTQVELEGTRSYEVHVEIPLETLRTYGLTLAEVASTIRTTAVEIPGGSVKTAGGEILLRMTERRDWAREFESIPIKATSDGSMLLLGDIARIRDGFEETDAYATFDGERGMGRVRLPGRGPDAHRRIRRGPRRHGRDRRRPTAGV